MTRDEALANAYAEAILARELGDYAAAKRWLAEAERLERERREEREP